MAIHGISQSQVGENFLKKIVGLAASSALLKNHGKNSTGQEEVAETPEDLLAAADAALITSFKGAEFFLERFLERFGIRNSSL